MLGNRTVDALVFLVSMKNCQILQPLELIILTDLGRFMFVFSTVAFQYISLLNIFIVYLFSKVTWNFFTFMDSRKHVLIAINQSMAQEPTNERGSSKLFRFFFSRRQTFIWKYYRRCGLTVSCTRLFGKHPWRKWMMNGENSFYTWVVIFVAPNKSILISKIWCRLLYCWMRTWLFWEIRALIPTDLPLKFQAIVRLLPVLAVLF